ncbi:MAG TPA: preprotein translocase subunit SecY [Bdellovibrionota bacterium]|nr:preprotein translocase subunit SecY [Bdellovibrionota bacterium]
MANIANVAKIPELRNRILFSLGLVAVYRLGVQVPVPGVDAAALHQLWADQGRGTLLEVFNLFSGGALENFSIFALGIMPYISSSIILQLLTVVFPYLDQLQKEGEFGRRKITQYTRYLTVFLSCIQGFMMATMFEHRGGVGQVQLVINPGWAFKFQTVVSLASGTSFLMWLGEQMTERGVGNGISLIIFSGIVAGFPGAVIQTVGMIREGEMQPLGFLMLLVLMLAVVYAIIFFEQAQRRVPVQYAKRIVGRRMYQGQGTYFPIKLNSAGVIPPIFASSLLVFPATISSWAPGSTGWIHRITDQLNYGGWLYNSLYVALIVFFCYFYTAIQLNPDDVAENMKKYGGYVPGIRPGKTTAEYIERVVERLTLIGALYISAVCVLPMLLKTEGGVSFYFGGTSLLIVVGVALDTVAQIEAHLLTHHYEGFLGPRASRIKSRRG